MRLRSTGKGAPALEIRRCLSGFIVRSLSRQARLLLEATAGV